MKKIILLLISAINIFYCHASPQKYEVTSPDNKILVTIVAGESISYSISYQDKMLISPSSISINSAQENLNPAGLKITGTSKRFVDNKIYPPVREKRDIIPDTYNQLILNFKNQVSLEFRAYNDGVSYRFSTKLPGNITVTSEDAEFSFQPGTVAFYPQVSKRSDADIFHTSFEENYTKALLDTVKDLFAFSPVLLQHEGLPNLLITESDVNDYPGMFLGKNGPSGLKGRFAGYPLNEVVTEGGFRQKLVSERADWIARTEGTRTFPWRIIAIAPGDADLLTNDIVYRLAPVPAFKDFSWIKPGKSTEEWITGLNLKGVDFITGLNTETYKYYIDFASRFGFQYVMLDAGWSDVNDLFQITHGMDMEQITSYARDKGIGLILWTQALTIDKQMDQALRQFKKWDIKIVMTDFIDRNDQLAIDFLHRFAGECAKNKFMCMIHGAPIPAGFSRTYPNMVARESVLGSEYNAWSSKANPEHDLLLPFIRMVSGPMDYEPGLLQNATRNNPVKMGFEKVIAQGTTMHQVAMFEIYESPLQLFSGNLSDAIREPELISFLGTIPTVWDETRVLKAKLGSYIVEARRNGDNWYLAGINDWTPVTFKISLDFIKEGNFKAEIATDGINAAKNPEDYKILSRDVSCKDSITITLAPGGGYLSGIIRQK